MCEDGRGNERKVKYSAQSMKSRSLHTLLTRMSLVGVVCDICSVLLEE